MHIRLLSIGLYGKCNTCFNSIQPWLARLSLLSLGKANGCVYLALPGNASGVAADGFSNAKIDELELPLNHEEVGRLEI